MIQIFYIDEAFPLEKDIIQIVRMIEAGEIFVFPTDTVYAIGCSITNKVGIDKLLKFTGKMDKKARLSILCKDISSITDYTLPFSSQVFRTLKEYSPGPVTFILKANNHLARQFKIAKTEIGVRIPSNNILKLILNHLEFPIISTSLKFDDADENEQNDPDYILNRIKYDVDVMIHSSISAPSESTIIDCTSEDIEVIREGKLIL